MAQHVEPSANSEALRLPEVVITGVDRSKIQRMVPKIVPLSSLPVLTQSSWDISDSFVQEGDLFYLNRARQAEERFVNAIELDPTNGIAYLRLGDVYRSFDKYVEAEKVYKNAIKTSAGLEAHYKLGILYETHLQDLQQAIAHYQTYRQLGGLDTRARVWLRNAKRRFTQE